MFAWLIVMAITIGFCLWLWARREEKKATSYSQGPSSRRTPGEFDLAVVGESHYQKALDEICGGKTEEGHQRNIEAQLIPEPKNPHDKNAVRVEIAGQTVGYLSQGKALRYAEAFGPKTVTACGALITGGWKRKDSEGSYGVSLDLNL